MPVISWYFLYFYPLHLNGRSLKLLSDMKRVRGGKRLGDRWFKTSLLATLWKLLSNSLPPLPSNAHPNLVLDSDLFTKICSLTSHQAVCLCVHPGGVWSTYAQQWLASKRRHSSSWSDATFVTEASAFASLELCFSHKHWPMSPALHNALWVCACLFCCHWFIGIFKENRCFVAGQSPCRTARLELLI